MGIELLVEVLNAINKIDTYKENIMYANEEYEYDEVGRLKKVTYEDGTLVEYMYDEVGNLTDVKVIENKEVDNEKSDIDNNKDNDIDNNKENNKDSNQEKNQEQETKKITNKEINNQDSTHQEEDIIKNSEELEITNQDDINNNQENSESNKEDIAKTNEESKKVAIIATAATTLTFGMATMGKSIILKIRGKINGK